MNEFSPEQPQAARQFSSVGGTHDPLTDESGLSIEPTPAESRQSTMSTDATDRLANGEIGAEAPVGQHTYEQAGSHDCELVVAPTGQGITASLEARASRTLISTESNFVQNMTTDSNPALTPSEEEVQKPASAPSVQPQSSNGCTPEVASGSPVSTLSTTPENKSEGVNLPAAAEGEPSAEAEFGSSAATNSNQSKAMKANQIEKVSSGQAEEDAQVNACEQTVQPSVEINACAASPSETEQIASPQAEPPSAVSTDSTNSDAAALASATLNSGTDFAATTNTNTVMNTTSNTSTAGNFSVEGKMSNIVSTVSFFPKGEDIPCDANVTPEAENGWTLIHAGQCIDAMNVGEMQNLLVLQGSELKLEVPTLIAPYLLIDDEGCLVITPIKLTNEIDIQNFIDTLENRGAANYSHTYYFSKTLGIGDWTLSDLPFYWKPECEDILLPSGVYYLYGRVSNKGMAGSNMQNRILYRYAIAARNPIVSDNSNSYGAIREICVGCGCGHTDDGDADFDARSAAPGWEKDPCLSFVTFNRKTGGAIYDSPWRWKAEITENEIIISPPLGEPLYFSLPAEGNSEAGTIGASSIMQNFVQFLADENGTPTTERNPAYLLMKDKKNYSMIFNMSTGEVHSIKTPRCYARADERREHVSTIFDDDGNLLYCSSSEGTLICKVENGKLENKWFSNEINDILNSSEDTPYKSETWQLNGNSLYLTRQEGNLEQLSLVRTEDSGEVIIKRGIGDNAIIKTFRTTYPINGYMVRESSTSFTGEQNLCDQTLQTYIYTPEGWKLSRTILGYKSNQESSITYIWGENNRVTKERHSNGNCIHYEYDSKGRVVMEKRPWGNGLAKIQRITYTDTYSHDITPSSIAEYYVNNSGTEILFRITNFEYLDTYDEKRTITKVTAGGSSQQQVSIEETFGSTPAYAYAAGRPKFSQGIDGVQTWHDYEATTDYEAVHKHTIITKANGELVAAQSRKKEQFIAANDSVTFEQESIWDGTQWLLLDTTAYEYDEQKRITKTTRGNGRFSSATWMCCGRLSETDEDGITTTYAYDSARQLTEISREEVYDGETCITPEIITEFTRDAAGRVLTTIRRVGSMETTESTEYDALGRVTKQTDVLGRETTTEYSANGLVTTVISPAGATTITVHNPDGTVASISGTAQRALVYEYDLNGNSLRTTTKLADGTTIAQSIVNGFDQTTVQAQASTSGFIYTRAEFNAKGQLVKQYQDTGWNTVKTAATLYEYDCFGNITKQTLALSDMPTKDNSPVVEMAYSVESAEDGVFSVTTQTRYNAAGEALISTQKQLISHLSSTLASKSIGSDERGNNSTNWTVYTAPAKVTSYSTIPTSSITAESVVMDGFTISQKDYAGIVSTTSRAYTVSGMTLMHTDGRNNANIFLTDLAGRTISVTDASGAVTTTVYDVAHDHPSVITDAMGNTSCYKYDHRGRKIAEWGTAIQPACFGYDDMDNMTMLMTFRGYPETNADGSPSQSGEGAAAGDVTTWTFHPATGLELSKTYADNSTITQTYDLYNRHSTETDARGNVKSHIYEHARGLHLGTTYIVAEGTAATADRSLTYNHLGMITQIVDDAGTRTFGYNTYGERETDSLVVDGDTHLITEQRDSFGRSTGYTYAKNGSVQQTVTTGYGDDGRISAAGFLHGGETKNFGYTYLAGTNLLQVLTKPNDMTLTQTYEATRDLLTGMAYHRGSTLVAQREYTYDLIGRPTARTTSRQSSVVNDTFVHNTRSELVEAQVSGKEYEYTFDNIGNRLTSHEDNIATMYATNELNQYTSISENGTATFVSQFDADGNQTLIKTDTGIWSAVYNAENRPVSFTNNASNTVVECQYDSMGRRAYKKITVDGLITLHQRYIYRDYLQIACLDLTRSHHPCLWLITWDPSQTIETRPLAIQKDGTWYTYGHDISKNVCEVFKNNGYIGTSYTYSSYGKILSNGTTYQTLKLSSEFYDEETGLYYYNFRYYLPYSGKWISRDIVRESTHRSLYCFAENNPSVRTDYLGLVAPGFGTNPADLNYVADLIKDMFNLSKSEPTVTQSVVPVIGSMHEALYAFGQGSITMGMFHLMMAASDVFLIKSIASSGIRFTIKKGSHSWKATRKWYGKLMDLPPGTEVHHVFFHQGQGIGKYLPRGFINQPWNLEPIFATAGQTSKQIHINIIHCHKIRSFTDARIYMKYAIPNVYKLLILSTADKAVKIIKGMITKDEERDDIEIIGNIDIEIPDYESIPLE